MAGTEFKPIQADGADLRQSVRAVEMQGKYVHVALFAMRKRDAVKVTLSKPHLQVSGEITRSEAWGLARELIAAAQAGEAAAGGL